MIPLEPKPVDGIVLLNKAQGITSNTALQQVKRLLGAKKAGHTGSLDPLATGMLPLCFGEATKVSQYLLEADKIYETTGRLGITTTTADATGEVLEVKSEFIVTKEQLEIVLSRFKGKQSQIPSMYSALKHQGKPLYRYAREGKTIERAPREIEISRLQLDSFDGIEFALTVQCSKGTYIRNLVEDIGLALKVGAHVTRLHRVATAGLQNYPMLTFTELQGLSPEARLERLLPLDKAVANLPSLLLRETEILAIRQGKIISKESNHPPQQILRLYDEEQHFIGLGICEGESQLKAKRLCSLDAAQRNQGDQKATVL